MNVRMKSNDDSRVLNERFFNVTITITYIYKSLSVLHFIIIALVSQLPNLLVIFINSQHIPDSFIAVIRNDSLRGVA